jgi:tRNA(Ile)-lysidine synthase
MKALIEKVKQTIDQHKMLNESDRILVALSGGPDSVALLYILHEIREEWARLSRAQHATPLRLAAAHLDHAIRPDSAKDREFCRTLCQRLKVRFHAKRLNIAASARRRKLSVEEAGRNARYEYFEFLARKFGYTRIATGHTLDDSIETVIFNLTRGSGLAGLAGIPAVRGKIIRPLIDCEKAELLEFLGDSRIDYLQDPTNVTMAYSRNKIRNRVVPMLVDINPAAKRNIARLSGIVTGELEYIRASSVSAYNLAVLKADKTKIVLDLELLDRYHEILRKKVVEEAVRRLVENPSGLTSGALDRALRIIDGKSGGKAPLITGIYIEKSSGRVAVAKEIAKHRGFGLKVPGKTALPGDGAFLRTIVKPRERVGQFDPTNRSAYLDRQKAKNLTVRFWRLGDKIKPLGMRGHRLLSDIFIDKKIPEFERGSIPLVISGGKIAWIAGVMVSDDFKVTRNTKQVLSIELCEP